MGNLDPQTEKTLRKHINKAKRWRFYWIPLNAICPIFFWIFLPDGFLFSKIVCIIVFVILYIKVLIIENDRIKKLEEIINL
jgi:hypothetical protein